MPCLAVATDQQDEFDLRHAGQKPIAPRPRTTFHGGKVAAILVVAWKAESHRRNRNSGVIPEFIFGYIHPGSQAHAGRVIKGFPGLVGKVSRCLASDQDLGRLRRAQNGIGIIRHIASAQAARTNVRDKRIEIFGGVAICSHKRLCGRVAARAKEPAMSNTGKDTVADCESRTASCETIERIIRPRVKDLGGGFKVRRVLPFHAHKMVGPFIFFDHFGPSTYAPGDGFDVRPHPHIGLATVTYLFEGAIAHRDTLGTELVIRPGAVNWMTAGKGICHSERTPPEERAAGQAMHGIQTWVALPQTHSDVEPAFEHHRADTLPVIELGGAEARLIAGTAWGHTSPVEFPWGIWYLAVDASEPAAFDIPADAAEERAVYVVDGRANVDGETLEPGDMAVLTQACEVNVKLAANTKVMLTGGQSMDGPRKIEWNFVAADPDRLKQAKADWQASIDGNFTGTPFELPPGESEWIPLPTDS